MATIKEIAEIVGVSSAAVSRVLNYDEGISVSDETRDAIFSTAEKLGYKKELFILKSKMSPYYTLQIIRMNWRMIFIVGSEKRLSNRQRR